MWFGVSATGSSVPGLRGALKAIRAAIDKNEFDAVKDQLKAAVSLVDRMASKGIIHRTRPPATSLA